MFDWAKNFADNFFANATDAIHKLVKLKAAIWLGRLLSAVGLGFEVQKFIYNPIIEYAQTAWSSLPAGIAMWVHALGIDAGVAHLHPASATPLQYLYLQACPVRVSRCALRRLFHCWWRRASTSTPATLMA